ncbi:MAG: PLP-dependent aminotransferase family protein [Steroidobacteraceae bacterium]
MQRPAFADLFCNPAGSPIRELFPYLSRPGMISFAGGYPSAELFDAEGLRDAAAQALADTAANFQYGATEGAPLLREALASLSASRGIDCGPADILVTTGSQQAFDLLVRIFINAGDVVHVETPAYPAAIQALKLAGARIEAIPADQAGLQVEAAAAKLELAQAVRPKLLYTVPAFSNPCGTLLPLERREALVHLAIEHGFFIVEDDPYSDLAFTKDLPPPLFAIGERLAGRLHNPVIYLSSLSKTVAPGLRIGWMIAPQEVLRRCAIAKQTSDLCTSPLAQAIAALYLRSGRYPHAVARACTEYGRRMHAMIGALQKELPGTLTVNPAAGGLFLWAESRAQADPQQLFQAHVDHGVLYVPGTAFYPADPNPASMRLSYGTPGVEQILEGVRRMGRAFRAVGTNERMARD